jgi:sugar O-acyltransferase (sialic acid O-acetyltransferase NeuD family)
MNIILCGAGAFALEIEQYILDCKRAGSGIYDDVGRPANESATLWGAVFTGNGRLSEFQTPNVRHCEPGKAEPEDAHYLIAIGDAVVRRRVWGELQAMSAHFATIIHPTSSIAQSVRIGRGVILCPFTFAGPLSVLGNNTAFNTYASVGHDSVVGDHCVFSPYACVNGAAKLGEACFLGSSVVVTPRKTIGAYSKVSAGSIVFSDARPGSLLIGNPAKGRQLFPVPSDAREATA